MSMDTFKIKK